MSFGSDAGSGGLAMCFCRGNRVKDSSENPDTGRREAGTELQRIARPDAMIKEQILVTKYFYTFLGL
jgi:hypothetical protein